MSHLGIFPFVWKYAMLVVVKSAVTGQDSSRDLWSQHKSTIPINI